MIARPSFGAASSGADPNVELRWGIAGAGSGRYEHPTAVMVAELMRDLEQRWHTADSVASRADPRVGGSGFGLARER